MMGPSGEVPGVPSFSLPEVVTMEVVRSGKDDREFGKEFTCRGNGFGKGVGGCGAVLRLMPCDVACHVDCDGDATHWFVCPECGAKTYLSHDALRVWR